MLIRRVGSWPFEKSYTNEFSEWDRLRRELGQLLDPRRNMRGVDLPAGVFPLEVSVTGRTVTIAGERKIPSEDYQVSYHRREREEGKFRRQFNLPTDVDSDQVQAKYRHGMLMIVLPKAESAKPKKIMIRG